MKANEELIRDHEDKLSRRKRTRRVVPDSLFIQVTRIMSQMRDIFHRVKISPYSALNQYTMMEYYNELSSHDRASHDAKRDMTQPGHYTSIKVFPICASAQDREELQKVVPLCNQLIACFDKAPAHYTWPNCLKCCCCKTKKRTACCCKYTVLFGQIKQLGLILKTQFNADHHWIRT